MGFSIKRLIRNCFAAYGYTIRDVGRGVGGVDLLHDARVLLDDAARPVLFDVGANIGQTTLAMLDRFRFPQIYSFEPSPSTFEMLQRAVNNRSAVFLEPVAMGEEEGVLPFHVTKDHSVNDSLLIPKWNSEETIIQVRVDTVDAYCQRRGVPSIGLLKIDAQGYDLSVLKGARKMLASRRIALYSCEVNFEAMYYGQATLRDLMSFAEEVGYRLVGFYEQSYVKNRLSYLDALFTAS